MKSRVGHSSEVVKSASRSELGMLDMVEMNGIIVLLQGKLNGNLLLIFPFIHPRKLLKTLSDEEVIVTHVIE